MVKIETDLPGGKKARAWVGIDAIVVEVNGKYTIAVRQRCNKEQLAEIAEIFAEAAK